MDIVEFLRARLDEDEAAARGLRAELEWQIAKDGYTADERGPVTPSRLLAAQVAAFYSGGTRWRNFARGQFIAKHGDPARVLREVEAKRQILFQFEFAMAVDDFDDVVRVAMRSALRHLSAVYVDHPDYDPKWAS